MKFFIIIPTYRRTKLLRKALTNLTQQTFSDWRAAVVHDGPSEEFDALAAEFGVKDARFHFLSTKSRSRDSGNSPRRLALESWARDDEFVLFWDDDNLFFRTALSSIAGALNAYENPDLLLVPFFFRGAVLPKSGEVATLQEGEIDSANLVVRGSLVRSSFERALAGNGSRYAFDSALLEEIKRSGHRVCACPELAPIGIYDGLKPYGHWGQKFPLVLWAGYWFSRHRLAGSVSRALAAPRFRAAQ